MIFDYAIIGGGIAGVTCLETLHQLDPESKIALVSGSETVKSITNIVRLTKLIDCFDVEERSSDSLKQIYPNVTVLSSFVNSLDCKNHSMSLEDNSIVQYKKLCICSGASPKLIAKNHPHVVGIRDTDSVTSFQNLLKGCRRIIIVGNGGIATEMVYAVEGCDILWAIKDSSISSTFVDAGAATFLKERLLNKEESKSSETNSIPSKRVRYSAVDHESKEQCSLSRLNGDSVHLGVALGPDWINDLKLQGRESASSIKIIPNVEVSAIYSEAEWLSKHSSECTESWPVFVALSNGDVHGVDLIVSATGVAPELTAFLSGNNFAISEESSGLLIDEEMRTSEPDVYGAGDCCSVGWNTSKHWFQMRLWSQARQMGYQAARCMVSHQKDEGPVPLDFCFELFTHVTKFFGMKVILLGLFNGQTLPMTSAECEILLRVTPNLEYVKCVMQSGRMQGAILIGETDLEETFENLILNQLDLSRFNEDLLNPDIDIEDYFD